MNVPKITNGYVTMKMYWASLGVLISAITVWILVGVAVFGWYTAAQAARDNRQDALASERWATHSKETADQRMAVNTQLRDINQDVKEILQRMPK